MFLCFGFEDNDAVVFAFNVSGLVSGLLLQVCNPVVLNSQSVVNIFLLLYQFVIFGLDLDDLVFGNSVVSFKHTVRSGEVLSEHSLLIDLLLKIIDLQLHLELLLNGVVEVILLFLQDRMLFAYDIKLPLQLGELLRDRDILLLCLLSDLHCSSKFLLLPLAELFQNSKVSMHSLEGLDFLLEDLFLHFECFCNFLAQSLIVVAKFHDCSAIVNLTRLYYFWLSIVAFA